MVRLNTRSGFTMIEIMVVIVLIGLLTGIVLTRNSQSNAGLVGETAVLKSYVRFVQALAMSDNTTTWALRVEPTQYTLMQDAAVSSVNLPDADAAVRTIPAPTQVTVISIVPNDTIEFDEWGSPGSQDYTITLGDGSNPNKTITVTKNTGFIP